MDLRYESLETAKYCALSYCWGSKGRTHEVQINRSRVSISHGLYLALQELLKQGVTAWLWIDAICIDQSDTAEKTQQVRHMGEIYKKAETVYTYLAETHSNCAVAMELVKRIGPLAVKAGVVDYHRFKRKEIRAIKQFVKAQKISSH